MQPIKIKTVVTETLENYKAIFGLVKESLNQGKTLFKIYFVIATLCCLVFFASFYLTGLNDIMSASALTPWGIVTSVIVHSGGLNHLSFNLLGLFLWFILFLITNNSLKDESKRYAVKSFVAIIFTAGFVSTFLWVILKPDSHTSGLSGVVYASEGVILALSLINTLSLSRISKPLTAQQKRRYLLWLFNVFIFVFILLSLMYSPSLFLNKEQNVNFFVHGISFLGTFCFSVFWTLKDSGILVAIAVDVRRLTHKIYPFFT